MQVAVVDYGLGNVQSVIGAIEILGFNAILTNDFDELSNADALILPGVGAFGDGMKHLTEYGLVKSLNRLVLEEKKPILGICLGMQLFASRGHEFGEEKGLGWIDAEVIKFNIGSQYKLPHVGWNDIEFTKSSRIFEGVENKLFYFVHSYHFVVEDESDVLAICEYDKPFVSAVNKNNIYGTQFHPEKSQKEGLLVIENFLKKCCNA